MPLSRRALLAGSVAAGAALAAACAKPAKQRAIGGGGTTTTSAAKGAAGATAVPSSAPEGLAGFVAHGDRGSGLVALTFHGSGDITLVSQLLDHARQMATPITIFAVGQWLDANPQMARRILDGGHELANHTYTHPALGSLDRAGVAREIARCRDALAARAGTTGLWFRPSGIEQPTEMMLDEAAKAGYSVVVGYDVDPHDYEDPGAAAVMSRTRAAVQSGSIVSLHTGHAGTVAAFDTIVNDIRAKGLKPVKVRELLHH